MKNLPPSLRFLEANAWALEPRVFEALAEIVERHAAGIRLDGGEIAAAIGREPEGDRGPREPAMQVVNGTAVIGLRGVIARYSDQVNDVSQPTGRSAESLLADIAKAQADQSVRRVVLRIDSPGGTVAGTAEIGDAVRALSASGKAVFAFVDGQACSAAYWIASQADEVVASSTAAMVGSIGVIGALVERATGKDVVKVHVIRSAPLKAPGAMGGPVSDEQLASMQRMFTDLHEAFAVAVAGGRGLSKDQQAAATTGESFVAARAKALGLIDSVEPWGAFVARISADVDRIDVQGDPMRIVATLSADGTSPEATTAGIQPAPSPETPAGTETMKITVQVFAALIAAHAMHSALISSMATGDPAKGLQPASEDEIRAAITKADHKVLTDRVAELEAQAAAEATEKAAALAKVADLEAKLAFRKNAGEDPGADSSRETADPVATEWAAMNDKAKAGYFNNPDAFREAKRLMAADARKEA